MKRTVIIILCSVLLWGGCSTVESKALTLTQKDAQGALLNLVRSNASPFEGADPARFEKITAVHKKQKKFNWGSFAIDLNKRTYVANINSRNSRKRHSVFQSYSKKFSVNHAGLWKARNVTKKRVRKNIQPDELDESDD